MTRHSVLPTLFILIGLPPAVAAVSAVSYIATNHSNGSFVSAGTERDYVLYVPPSYDGTKDVPLVMSFHGAGGFAAAQRRTSGWNQIADREGFIVVYPSGYRGEGARIWHIDSGRGRTRDTAFVAALIDTIGAHYRIDRRRVYANGLSAGGGMSWMLACTMSNRFAAVGLVAPAILLPPASCTDPTPMPMIQFHGVQDWQIPYEGGKTALAPMPFPNVPHFVQRWARRNRCDPTPRDLVVNAQVTRRSYYGCASGADVVLYTVKDGGHSWPGGIPLAPWFAGHTSQAIEATDTMWEFFKGHPRY
jgi:polyhydroxybutyrate depolymerase